MNIDIARAPVTAPAGLLASYFGKTSTGLKPEPGGYYGATDEEGNACVFNDETGDFAWTVEGSVADAERTAARMNAEAYTGY